MRIARHIYVAYMQDVTGLSYILAMVATHEIQFYIGRNVMFILDDTHAHCKK